MSMMPTVDSKNLEILRMARELVINEHTDRRAEMHNQWLAESNELWRTRRIRLAYPSIPPYPTENDIIARAQVLLDFLTVSSPANAPESADDTTATAPIGAVTVTTIKTIEPVIVETPRKEPIATAKELPDSLPTQIQDPITPVTPTPTVQELMDYMKEAKAAEPEPTGILPSLLKKIEEIRGNRNSNAE